MIEHRFFIPFALIALTACGGGAGATTSEEGEEIATTGGEEQPPPSGHEGHPSARELIGVGPPAQPWSTMSHEDKEMDMIGRFLPIMSEVFQEYDPQRFAELGCETCHGTDMRERNFEMPSDQLPPVPLAGTPAYQQMAESDPAMTRFMEEQVTPTMQTLLGMGATFTCNGCHPSVASP
jgi:hypothetical protein